MKILIIGGGGMIGQKLASRLATDRKLGEQEILEVTLFDVVSPVAPGPPRFPSSFAPAIFRMRDEVKAMLPSSPTSFFTWLPSFPVKPRKTSPRATVSTWTGLATCWTQSAPSMITFHESYSQVRSPCLGAPFPDAITDDFHTTPLTSYGTQKAIGELLLSDFSRRGMMDGIGIRLPTICVRPGRPNKAASGFFSNIIREPLAGAEAVLPVSDDVLHWHASPRSAVGFLLHAATIDGAVVGLRRNLTMPGIAVTVGEQIPSAANCCR